MVKAFKTPLLQHATLRTPALKKVYINDDRGLTMTFLPHLSQRLIGELIVYPCSGVRRCRCRRCRPPFSNGFTSETAWPIETKFYLEPPWEGRGAKVYINGPGHMTKMAAMSIYGKQP